MKQPAAARSEVGVDVRTLDVWPAITPEEWTAIEPALLGKMGSVATEEVAVGPNGFHELQDGEIQRSSIHIPAAVIDEKSNDSPNLITYADIVAEALGRTQLRYGVRATTHTSTYFVGFSKKLSSRDIQLCLGNRIGQFKEGQPIDEPIINEVDGSQTLGYRPTGRFGDIPIKHRLKRVRMLHAHVLEHVAPQLEKGIIVAPILVPVKKRGYPTLFTPGTQGDVSQTDAELVEFATG